jgi:FO synthase
MRSGDDVTYVVNRNINFTNVCYTGCRFCAFAQRRTDADAYSLSLDEVGARAAEAWDVGATEVCMQGGIDPQLPGTAYLELARAVKAARPACTCTPTARWRSSTARPAAGCRSRSSCSPPARRGSTACPARPPRSSTTTSGGCSPRASCRPRPGIEVVTTAHRLGIPTTSTMMYGHVDQPHHWVAHLQLLARLQDRSGGFTEFVPLPFVHHSSPIYLAGVARPGPTVQENRAVHAMARLLLHGRIANIQASWVKLGVDGVREVLRGGVNDLGGTLMEETISRMAGSQHGSRKSVDELTAIAHGVGRPVRQRTTTYSSLSS